ncbi:MAG: hypothetical protein AABX12_00620 [Nanoarchaeota archaeon]
MEIKLPQGYAGPIPAIGVIQESGVAGIIEPAGGSIPIPATGVIQYG